MHPNPAFRKEDEARALAVARERGFGVLTASGPDGVLASHVPFELEPGRVAAHLARGGALARHLRQGPVEALLIVAGPDAYISPDWYGADDQVPTWNYVAIHIRGRLELLPDEALRPHLERLSALHEGRLAPKMPWTTAKMTPGLVERMMRQIVPIGMAVTGVESTFKLNQNKTSEMRLAAAEAVATSPDGQEADELARLMREQGEG